MPLSNSSPKNTLETRFYDLKMSNAITVKIVESEVDFRVLHSKDWTNLAMQTGTYQDYLQ